MKSNAASYQNLMEDMQATVPHIVDYLVKTAIKLGASDIHLGRNNDRDAGDYDYLVRFRVDGELQLLKSNFINEHYDEVIARIKVLAKMDTNAVGKTQDGQITINPEGDMVVLRVNILPGFQGTEEVCIRIQKSSDKDISLNELVMTGDMRTRLENIAHQKSGMLILNGPAGSGKTTTVYALLREIAGPHKKIITAEDPVEMQVPYVNHVQVTEKATFADLGRCFMRQDAEVIFLGEIRDPESAISAHQLAQTGHLVFTTLHTRDAVGVVSRFEAFGIHRNFIAHTLIGSLAQRLVVGLCPQCKVPDNPNQEILDKMNSILPIPEGTVFYKNGPGCEYCKTVIHDVDRSSGYFGRIPVFELLVVDEDISDLINGGAKGPDIMSVAQSKGMYSLQQEALIRLYQGIVDVNAIRGLILMPSY